jgi:hypothetical protein
LHKPETSLDTDPWHSQGHPDPEGLKFVRNVGGRPQASQDASQPAKRQRRDSHTEVYDVVVSKDLRTTQALLSHAKKMHSEGATGLLEFCLQHRDLDGFVTRCWATFEVDRQADRSRMTRLQILSTFLSVACVCSGQWIHAATQILQRNCIDVPVFVGTIRRSLEVGARKFHNVYIHGPSNSGKSFLLGPLLHVFRVFHKPAAGGSFRLLPLLDSEIILWNDWRSDDSIISWEAMLLLGEGAAMMVPRPQNRSDGDAEYKSALPLFLTSKDRLWHPDGRERQMMDSRFVYFPLTEVIPNPTHVEACPHCFATWIVGGGVIVPGA